MSAAAAASIGGQSTAYPSGTTTESGTQKALTQKVGELHRVIHASAAAQTNLPANFALVPFAQGQDPDNLTVYRFAAPSQAEDQTQFTSVVTALKTNYNIGFILDLTGKDPTPPAGVVDQADKIKSAKIGDGTDSGTDWSATESWLVTGITDILQFNAENPGVSIGVHCDHGQDRTGTMVALLTLYEAVTGLNPNPTLQDVQTAMTPTLMQNIITDLKAHAVQKTLDQNVLDFVTNITPEEVLQVIQDVQSNLQSN